jgi:hypothetical protein
MGSARFASGGTGAMLIAGATILVFLVGGKVVDWLQEKSLEKAREERAKSAAA